MNKLDILIAFIKALYIVFSEPFYALYNEIFVRKNVKALAVGTIIGIVLMILANWITDMGERKKCRKKKS